MIMTSLRSVLYVLVFIISLLLLSVRFLHTKCYNDILTDDFVPDERYTDYLENDRMEDVDVYALWKHYDSLSISYSYWAVSESIILDRDIHYYTEPDVHSEIMYTLKAGEVYYLNESKIIPAILTFATYDRGWRYAVPLADEQLHQEVIEYHHMIANERELIGEIPYWDQKFGYIRLEDIVYIIRKCELASGYFTLEQKLQMCIDDRYALPWLYGHDEYYWQEGLYVSPDLHLPYWRMPERFLLVLILLSAAGYGIGRLKREIDL